MTKSFTSTETAKLLHVFNDVEYLVIISFNLKTELINSSCDNDVLYFLRSRSNHNVKINGGERFVLQFYVVCYSLGSIDFS
jgi:hypothetical protein